MGSAAGNYPFAVNNIRDSIFRDSRIMDVKYNKQPLNTGNYTISDGQLLLHVTLQDGDEISVTFYKY